jgi:exosome complex component CSL4
MLRFEVDTKVVPGDRLGSLRQLQPGIGTYARGGNVYASTVGILQQWSNNVGQEQHQVVVSVFPIKPLASSQVLRVGQMILGRIQRVVLQEAVVEIIAAEGIGPVPQQAAEGQIRREDIRVGATEEIQVYEAFRPGDIVIAKIIAMGDTRRYTLTTAETELGVIRAVSRETGKPLVAVSWKEMECADTQVKEPRKCAKTPKNLQDIFSRPSR